MDNQKRPTIWHIVMWQHNGMWQLYGRGVWGRMDTSICEAESLCCSPETITLLIGCTPKQNGLPR